MAKNGQGVDINKLFLGGIASARGVFDYFLLIESGLLTHDEIDNLRPVAYSAMARDAWEDGLTKPEAPPVRFVKVHDAHTINSAGKPVLGGSAGAHGAIVIVRDPRDVAPSLAHQYDLSID